jgi:hypothetical protein
MLRKKPGVNGLVSQTPFGHGSLTNLSSCAARMSKLSSCNLGTARPRKMPAFSCTAQPDAVYPWCNPDRDNYPYPACSIPRPLR